MALDTGSLNRGFPGLRFWANMLSCLIIGFLLAIAPVLNESTRLLLIAGFCGWAVYVFNLQPGDLPVAPAREWLIATAYVMASVMIGLVVVFRVWQVFHQGLNPPKQISR